MYGRFANVHINKTFRTPSSNWWVECEEDLDIRRDDKGEIIGGISVNEIPF